MPGPSKKYTPQQRARAVGIAVVSGVTETERRTGIPKQTVDYWVHQPQFRHLRTRAKEEVIAEAWIGVQVGIAELVAGLRGDAPLRDKATAFDSLARSWALWTGEATARTEHRDITDADDIAIAAISELVGSAIASGGAVLAVSVEPGGNGARPDGLH